MCAMKPRHSGFRHRRGRSFLPALVALMLVGVLASARFWLREVEDQLMVGADLASVRTFVPQGTLTEQVEISLPPNGAGDASADRRGWARIFGNGVPSPNWGGRSDLELVVDGQRVGALRGGPMHFVPRAGGDGTVPHAVDLTGDGVPELLVEEYNMMAVDQHISTLYVFHFEPSVRCQVIDLPSGGLEIVPAHAGLPCALIVPDATYDLAFGDEPFFPQEPATVSLAFDGQSWVPNAALSRKPLEAFADLAWPEPDSMTPWETEPVAGEEPPAFVQFGDWGVRDALRLIYAGHADEAWKAFDALWPAHPEWSGMARRKMIGVLERSPYWNMLRELNGAALDR